MSPTVSGMGNSSLDTWSTGQAIQSKVWFGVLLQLRYTQCQRLLRRHNGSGPFLAEMWPSVPCSVPRSLRTVEVDSLRRPIVTLSDAFNLCQAITPDKRTGSDKRLRFVTAMLRQVFSGAQGASLAVVTTATMLAAMNARRHVFVTSDSSTSVKTTLPTPSESVPTL